jgi:hypothetical protein
VKSESNITSILAPVHFLQLFPYIRLQSKKNTTLSIKSSIMVCIIGPRTDHFFMCDANDILQYFIIASSFYWTTTTMYNNRREQNKYIRYYCNETFKEGINIPYIASSRVFTSSFNASSSTRLYEMKDTTVS